MQIAESKEGAHSPGLIRGIESGLRETKAQLHLAGKNSSGPCDGQAGYDKEAPHAAQVGIPPWTPQVESGPLARRRMCAYAGRVAPRRLSPRAFVQSASEHKTGGAWLVYGPDEYVKTETVRMAARAFTDGNDPQLCITHLVGAQTDHQEILEAALAVPMLSARSAVIVHDLNRLPSAHKAKLPARLDFVPDNCMLLCVGPDEPDRRTKLYQWFADTARDVACDPLPPDKAEGFAKRKLEELGTAVDEDALARLLVLTGPDAGRLAREAEKLSLYAGARVTVADVDVVAGEGVGCTTEDLVVSLLKGDSALALAQSRALRRAGVEPGILMGRLCGHFFDLRRVLSAASKQSWQLASTLRMPKRRAEELLAWLKSARPAGIALAIEHLARAESLLRSGRADSDLVCDQAILAVALGCAGRSTLSL